MDLEENDIAEFIQLWKEEFNETISPDEARHSASQLLELYVILTAPLPADQPSPSAEPAPSLP